jgi:hypothetical protein
MEIVVRNSLVRPMLSQGNSLLIDRWSRELCEKDGSFRKSWLFAIKSILKIERHIQAAVDVVPQWRIDPGEIGAT